MIGPDEQNNPTDKKQGEKPSVNEVHVDQTIDQTYDNTMADDSYFAVNVRDEDLRGAIISRTSTIKRQDRKSTRLNSSHSQISYAVLFFEKKIKKITSMTYNTRHTSKVQPNILTSTY